jgi:hypothetical protein
VHATEEQNSGPGLLRRDQKIGQRCAGWRARLGAARRFDNPETARPPEIAPEPVHEGGELRLMLFALVTRFTGSVALAEVDYRNHGAFRLFGARRGLTAERRQRQAQCQWPEKGMTHFYRSRE